MRLAVGVLLVASMVATAGCGAGDARDRVRWTLLAPLPAGASVDAASVSLRVGTSIAARPAVTAPGGVELPCDAGLTSRDADVLSVDMAERGSFALTGKSTGETTLVVDCAGETFFVAGRVTMTP